MFALYRSGMSQSKLLPRSHAEFRSKAFWETFFQERQKSGGTFEWYGEWKDIVGVVGPLIQSTSSILVVGCGNSSLSADLYDWGARYTV